ncbi:HAD family hydrolase [Mycobacterium sp. WMMD1722]|uniref:HAD family hydrolase n=1 Tax=Mycobacterium sp. WMMD1722 TaxID=3404117 RepID=UPI003BF60141
MSATDVIDEWLRSAAPAVVFDFNGTLSDDEPILFDIFSHLFADRLGWAMTAQDYRDHLLGRSDREIVEYAVRHHGRGTDDSPDVEELLRLRRDSYREHVAARSPILPDTAALVTALAGHRIPLAIVTGAQRDDVRVVLAHSAIGEHFAVLVAEEDVARGKPDPEGFQTAARLLDRRPGDILVFEDSPPGVRAALAAGMHCVAVAEDPSPELCGLAPAVVPRLSPTLVAEALLTRRPGR